MRPYDTVSVRGAHTKRLRSVRVLTTGESLPFVRRTSIVDSIMPDPTGEVIVSVPESVIDPYATVFALDFAADPQ
jgi:alpha-L-fucosidase